MHNAIKAAIESEARNAGPAIPAAGAITENIPAPGLQLTPLQPHQIDLAADVTLTYLQVASMNQPPRQLLIVNI